MIHGLEFPGPFWSICLQSVYYLFKYKKHKFTNQVKNKEL